MSNNEYTTASKFGGAAQVGQNSTYSKGAAASGRMVQNVFLIWLDQNINDNNKDCQNIVVQFRRVVNSINTYTNEEECIEFLKAIDNEKACMIMSGSLGQNMVPRVHDMSQVDSIFIYCRNKQYHEEWTKKWPKIKGIFTNVTPLVQALKKAAQQCEQDSMSISIMDTSGDVSKKNLDQLEPTFIYTQILKEILLTINFEEAHFMEFITYCCDVLAENEKELKNVKKFEEEYRSKTPIWWYSYNCFLYPMVNRALWKRSTDMIIKLGFFINDLHQHIERLHQEQLDDHGCNTSFTVYRGQGMLKKEFEKMLKTKGGLLAFNNFLSTSKERTVSLGFAHDALTNLEMVGVLFVMTIHPTQSTAPFASITEISDFQDKEDGVLFSIQTVFRIGEITPIDGNSRFFQVELTLTSDNDNDLRVLTDRIREETDPGEKGWYRLGRVLLKMGESKKAEQVYQILLRQTSAEDERGRIYHQLGLTKYHQEEYKIAVKFHEKALEIYTRTLSPTDFNLANCYNDIGMAYYNVGDYSKALSSYEKALEIQQQLLFPNHPDLGGSYNNIGLAYYHMGDYLKALSSHKKAFEIKQQSLPPNHPDLGTLYHNIGNVYYNIGNYSSALFSYEKDLEIKQQSLPPNHPHLGASYNKIGLVYAHLGNYSKELSSYTKALEINKQSLPWNHPSLANTYDNLGLAHQHMGNYFKAISYYELALDIAQRSLPSNHPDVEQRISHLERIKKKL